MQPFRHPSIRGAIWCAGLRARPPGGCRESRVATRSLGSSPAQPIGVWDELREDAPGLWVRGGADSVARTRGGALIEAGD